MYTRPSLCHLIQHIHHASLEGEITAADAHTVKMPWQCAYILGYGHIVVVKYDDKRQLALSRVVEGLEGHSAGKRPVAYHRHDTSRRALYAHGAQHTQRRRNGSAGMAGIEGIKFALLCLGKARKAVHLPERREFGRTAGQYFVDIGLVAHVEYDLILWRIKGALQRYGKLHHAEIGGEMPAGLGYRPHQKLPYLRGKAIKLILGNAPEILYAFDAVNVTGFHYIP